jgi:hypothetical protein
MSAMAKAQQLYERIRPSHVVHMSEEEASSRIRQIHEQLNDQSGRDPLKWHQRVRLEEESLGIKKALEGARKTSANQHGVEVKAGPCGGRATRVHVMRRDSKGRAMVIHEHRFTRSPGLSAPDMRAVEERVSQEIAREVAGIKSAVAANEERLDKLGLSPVMVSNQGAPAFAPIRVASSGDGS